MALHKPKEKVDLSRIERDLEQLKVRCRIINDIVLFNQAKLSKILKHVDWMVVDEKKTIPIDQNIKES